MFPVGSSATVTNRPQPQQRFVEPDYEYVPGGGGAPGGFVRRFNPSPPRATVRVPSRSFYGSTSSGSTSSSSGFGGHNYRAVEPQRYSGTATHRSHSHHATRPSPTRRMPIPTTRVVSSSVYGH
eukprot:TRINITY_DN41942_c0_g1_i1.p1 TRINITY_DN41942_c0_g1~~TRINITY_DN41942_c0_g1_i1.p1  ORF type:complete len:124 (-),score=18.62 TRINITY_DN41942_c0_g1_i1:136-507(-)